MDRQKYNNLLDEIWGHMKKLHDGYDIEAAAKLSSQWDRICATSDCIRTAVEKSSLTLVNGSRHCFTGKIYERVAYEDLRNIVYDIMKRMNLPRRDFAKKEMITKDVADVIVKYPSEVRNEIVVFNNCVLDTDTMKTYPHSSEFIQVSMLNYDYDPDAKVFMWYQFLNQVLPDKEKQLVLQMFLGAVFVDRSLAKIEKMLILKGSGSNGKSVVNDTVIGVLGRENVSMFGIKELICNGERKQNVAYMNGKRLNYCSEIQINEIGTGSDTLKVLISGEPLPARHPYGFNFMANNIPLLMANANQLPYLKDITHGMARRLCVLNFDVEIPEDRQNRHLSRDLEAEYPAIFNWIMEGKRQFVKMNYQLPFTHDLEDAIEECRGESSCTLRFMTDSGYKRMADRDADLNPRWMSLAQLYERYLRWCTAHKEDDVDSKTIFSRTLTSAGWRKRNSQYGVQYGVYGKVSLPDLQMQTADLAQKIREKRITPKMLRVDGIDYAQGRSALGVACGVGVAVIDRIVNQGKLHDAVVYADGRAMYDIEKALKVLRDEGLFLDTREKHLLAVQEKDLKYLRAKFNSAMRYHGLPFRKYKTEGRRIDGTVPVDDTMSIEEAREKARNQDFTGSDAGLDTEWLVGDVELEYDTTEEEQEEES